MGLNGRRISEVIDGKYLSEWEENNGSIRARIKNIGAENIN